MIILVYCLWCNHMLLCPKPAWVTLWGIAGAEFLQTDAIVDTKPSVPSIEGCHVMFLVSVWSDNSLVTVLLHCCRVGKRLNVVESMVTASACGHSRPMPQSSLKTQYMIVLPV